jgi:hypothetical protein
VAAFAIVSMIERTTYYRQSRRLQIGAAETLDVLAAVTQAAVHGAREPVPLTGRAPAETLDVVLRS